MLSEPISMVLQTMPEVDPLPDICLQNGLTPLHLCAQEDKVNVAAILVKNGAEVDSTTKVQ